MQKLLGHYVNEEYEVEVVRINDFESKLEECVSECLDGMTGQAAERVNVEEVGDGLSNTVTWSVAFNVDSFDPYYGDEDDTSVDVNEEELNR